MPIQADVGYWHFSEVMVPMRDVCSWRKTGSGQRWGEPTLLTDDPKRIRWFAKMAKWAMGIRPSAFKADRTAAR
jgi:hypothetical protein